MRWRVRLLLPCWSLLALAACGAPLATATPRATVQPPVTVTSPAGQVVPTALATATVPPVPASGATVPTTAPTVPPTPRPSPRPSPVAWADVAHWQGDNVMVTDPFTVRGPWRICWHLPGGTSPFTVMVGDLRAGTWDLQSGPDGAPVGSLNEPRGGSFQLMIHNTTPYTVTVQDAPAGGLSPGAYSVPCPWWRAEGRGQKAGVTSSEECRL